MNKVPHSIKVEKRILEELSVCADRENRTLNNYIETSLAIIAALIQSGKIDSLTSLMEGDKNVIERFKKLMGK